MKKDIGQPFPPHYFQNNLISLILFFVGVIDHVGVAFAFHLSMCIIRLTLIRMSQLIRRQGRRYRPVR